MPIAEAAAPAPRPSGPFASLLEFAVAVNRADPAALAVARDGGAGIPIDGADVKKLLGTLWFRGVVAQLSGEWRTRLFDALRAGAEFPDHTVKVGRRQARFSELGAAQLREAAARRSPQDAVRQDAELLADIARIWGDGALRHLRFREVEALPVPSAFSSLLEGIGFRPRSKAGARGAP
jgi:hypothetical protein